MASRRFEFYFREIRNKTVFYGRAQQFSRHELRTPVVSKLQDTVQLDKLTFCTNYYEKGRKLRHQYSHW